MMHCDTHKGIQPLLASNFLLVRKILSAMVEELEQTLPERMSLFPDLARVSCHPHGWISCAAFHFVVQV